MKNIKYDYHPPLVDIEKNLNKFDRKTRALIYESSLKEIYDETIDLKCLKCYYAEQDVDWEEIEEIWNKENYPKIYYPNVVNINLYQLIYGIINIKLTCPSQKNPKV